ncbi:hypothetical protein ABMC88_06125 [Sulfitobacter sp. HNIBRBA2951]|uniref:hypothetical protein n=1 Tax=Sulfitobacter aquimarinus TaxID=3158557 RepID=UPI0032DE9395
MKAIAEYFRDLASDDRYFGAEPPQPDAQMLARIAQREMSRHVEAREDKGRIVLSAHNAPEAAALVATQAAKDPAPSDAAELPDTDDVQADQAEADHAATEVEDTRDGAADSVEGAVEAVEPEAADVEDAPEMADIVEAPEVAHTEKADVEDAPAIDEPDIVPSLPDAEVEAFFADSTDTNTVEDGVIEVQPAAAQVRADSIADKLKRIRAVVSQQPDEDAAPDYSEDQHADGNTAAAALADVADADADEETDVLADTLRDIEDALEEDDAHDIPTADEALDDEESDDDDISAILSRLEADAADEDSTQQDQDDTFDDDFDAEDLSDNIMTAMGKGEPADAATDAENLFEDAQEPAPAEAAAPKGTVTPKPAAPRTRVLKVKRATLEAAIQAGQLEEYDDDTPAATAKTSSLSDEAEEELARELAELEADIQADGQDDIDDDYDDLDAYDDADDAPDLDVAENTTKAPRAQLDQVADDSFSRLMEETEQQMEEPEGSNRRDAFAHLRAAVAAKKADEAVGATDDAIESDEPYRDDLASVVRPRRPASSERTRTERPSEPRPAPLKLVAEQRIDTTEPRRVTPVRPRRVAAAAAPEAEMPEVEGSFADFASDVGATELPDLLEAAAAYLSFVEGHAEFSRPQLMTKVRQVEKENFTREDGLRSFGKLLREGKIEKLRGGRFQASEQIGFKPDARAAS